ncbi:MAG: hypothetical protein DRR19_21405 [Candidatus Parabeggiatoa sp. nov. 1]|nr:MAG: hypothetical protein DRR19_21405 [Gammaproteobacteria bacterium]
MYETGRDYLSGVQGAPCTKNGDTQEYKANLVRKTAADGKEYKANLVRSRYTILTFLGERNCLLSINVLYIIY